MIFRAGLIAGLLVLPSALVAQPRNCGDKNSSAEMDSCFGQELAVADKALNSAYGALVKKWGKDRRAISLLRESERAWISYRDKDCALDGYPSEGGTIHPTILLQCRIALTRKRTADLKTKMTCPEGDLACVH